MKYTRKLNLIAPQSLEEFKSALDINKMTVYDMERLGFDWTYSWQDSFRLAKGRTDFGFCDNIFCHIKNLAEGSDSLEVMNATVWNKRSDKQPLVYIQFATNNKGKYAVKFGSNLEEEYEAAKKDYAVKVFDKWAEQEYDSYLKNIPYQNSNIQEQYEREAPLEVLEEAQADFVKRVSKADWYYSYSDDLSVYRAGKAECDALKTEGKTLGFNWSKFNVENYTDYSHLVSCFN